MRDHSAVQRWNKPLYRGYHVSIMTYPCANHEPCLAIRPADHEVGNSLTVATLVGRILGIGAVGVL